MKRYVIPNIDVLLFDEEEDILTASATYAAKELNEYMFDQGVKSTTTIKLQDIGISSE